MTGRYRGTAISWATVILTGLYAAMVAEAALSAFREDESVRITRGVMRLLERKVQDLALRVKDVAASPRSDDRDAKAESARAAVADLLAQVREMLPATAAEVGDAQRCLDDVAVAAEGVREAPQPVRDAAMETYLARSERLRAHVDAIEDRMALLARESHRRTLLVLLAEAAAGIVVLVAAWVSLRRRQEGEETLREKAQKDAFDALSSYLSAARTGEPALRPAEQLRYFKHAALDVDLVVDALTESRRAHERDRRRFTFSYELVEALELADSERQVCETLARAAMLAFPTTFFQSFLADDGNNLLLPQLADGVRVCAPATPEGCPAIRKGRTLCHSPAGGVARCPCLTEGERTVTCAFVSVRGHAAGVAQLVGEAEEGYLETLVAMCFAAGARIGVLRTLGEREAQAAIDPLTGLANRRGMTARLAQLERSGEPFAVICADLDHFKRLNDTRGHEAGDRCLRLFARVLRDTCRTADLPVRQGGEEFAVILTRTGVAGAMAFAQRIRDALEEAVRATGVAFTASFGVAARPDHGATGDEILAAADAALYAAKERGRNRAEVFGEAAGNTPTPLALAVITPRESGSGAA